MKSATNWRGFTLRKKTESTVATTMLATAVKNMEG
jgi:hypothetical protein